MKKGSALETRRLRHSIKRLILRSDSPSNTKTIPTGEEETFLRKTLVVKKIKRFLPAIMKFAMKTTTAPAGEEETFPRQRFAVKKIKRFRLGRTRDALKITEDDFHLQ